VEQLIPSLVFYLAVLVVCLLRPNAGRIFLGIFFLVMAIGVNVVLVVVAPEQFVALGTDAPLTRYFPGSSRTAPSDPFTVTSTLVGNTFDFLSSPRTRSSGMRLPTRAEDFLRNSLQSCGHPGPTVSTPALRVRSSVSPERETVPCMASVGFASSSTRGRSASGTNSRAASGVLWPGATGKNLSPQTSQVSGTTSSVAPRALRTRRRSSYHPSPSL
jgi:hypothetical protein